MIDDQSTKDFLKRNVERAHQTPRRTSTAEGPRYVEKKGYGMVPTYLVVAKEKLKEEKRAVKQKEEARDASKKQKLWPLPEEQRCQILQKLQDEWQERNQEFQRFSFVVDTEMKRKRREELLLNLQQLEKDIETMSRPIVYVTDAEMDGQ